MLHRLGQGLVPYAEGRELQAQVHSAVVAGTRPATLIALEHEPVYTVGRRARSWERPDGVFVEPGHVPVIDVDRGGKTTWHGPGQLTVYPILRLRPPLDVIAYVRALEAAIMEFCASMGLETMRVEDRSGVWVPHQPSRDGTMLPERKVCALGVRVARGVTLHGVGLNVCPDLKAFSLERIIPCGIDDAGVTSLQAETGQKLSVAEVAPRLLELLEHHLEPMVADAT
nr:lipoyl(octanoyl) transferase LipB [Actinomyces trachealis]